MMKITITGPQGCGKSILAECLAKTMLFAGKEVIVAEEGQRIKNQKIYDVIIRTKQTHPPVQNIEF